MDNGAMTRDDRERYDIALNRHRADLLEYGAAQLDSIGHTGDATVKRQRAAYFREQADLLEQYRAGDISKEDFHVRRRNGRIPGGVYDESIQTDFSEPTPEELGVSIGGSQ